MMDKSVIAKGIACYKPEQDKFLRLLRMKKRLTADEFDRLFSNREFRHRGRKLLIPNNWGDGLFTLGMGQNGGNGWAFWLDLVQHMMLLNMVDAKTEKGMVVYTLPQ